MALESLFLCTFPGPHALQLRPSATRFSSTKLISLSRSTKTAVRFRSGVAAQGSSNYSGPVDGEDDETELLRSLGLDEDIPDSPEQLIARFSSKEFLMRRKLEETLESNTYDVLESNPWNHATTDVSLYVLAKGEEVLYTMRARTARSEVANELDRVLGSKESKRRPFGGSSSLSSINSKPSSPSMGSSSNMQAKDKGRDTALRRFKVRVEDVREGVLMFEDENVASEFCSLLEGEGQPCLGIAQMKASDIFSACEKSKALGILFRKGSVPPPPEELRRTLNAKKVSLEEED